MQASSVDCNGLDPQTRAFYQRTIAIVREAAVPFLVGGAYAFEHYTTISRHTKDLDLFVRRRDVERVLQVLAAAGYQTELTSPVWLGKAFKGDALIDIIFGSGNGIATVDDAWFDHSVEAEVLGMRVCLCPPEEIIWSKAFVMERDRYDGADIAHLVLVLGERLDWARLLHRFGAHWRVLLSHLTTFGFIYPGERRRLPAWVMRELLGRLQEERGSAPPSERLCQGPLLARSQYTADVERWGYADARLPPWGTITAEEATC